MIAAIVFCVALGIALAVIRRQRSDISNLQRALRAQSEILDRMNRYIARRNNRETNNARVLRHEADVGGWPRIARPRLH